MSSQAPSPPKQGGSGGYIAAAVVMLLLIGGLVIWKLKSSGDTDIVDQIPSAAPKATEEPSSMEEPAPPPPPEEEVAAKPVESAEKKVTSGGATGPAGCNAVCTGNLSAQGTSALRAKGGQARGCYNRALRLNATLEGKMTVAMKISPTGAVCSASVRNDTLGDPSVSTCVAQMFRAGKYPAPAGGCVDTEVPLNFVSKQ